MSVANGDDSRHNDDDAALTEAQRNLRHAEQAPETVAPLYRFVVTGGPCGGKTTALARVSGFLRERSFDVITVPEAFTMLVSNGMSYDFFDTPGMDEIIQGAVLDTMLSLEDTVARVLHARGRPSVVLCDRGALDGAIYLGMDRFARLAADRGTDVVQLRDQRYDAIFHLVTAADGAEYAYTLENNAVRTETPEQAIQVDMRTQQCWLGHPHLYVLDNATNFEHKMQRLIDVTAKLVGLPSNLKRRSAKFLLSRPPDLSAFPSDVGYQLFEVEKIYLHQSNSDNPNDYSFIRRRTSIDTGTGKHVGSVFQLTMVQHVGDEMIEQKRIITEREYQALALTRDAGRHVVRQRRVSFLYQLQSFNVHVYEHPVANLCILHAQVEAGQTPQHAGPDVTLPPFLQVERRLTNDTDDEQKYGAYSLSLIHEKLPPTRHE